MIDKFMTWYMAPFVTVGIFIVICAIFMMYVYNMYADQYTLYLECIDNAETLVEIAKCEARY